MSYVIPKKSASAANPSTFHPGFAENAAEKAVGTKVQKEWGSCHPCHHQTKPQQVKPTLFQKRSRLEDLEGS